MVGLGKWALCAAALALAGCNGGEKDRADVHLTPKLLHHGKLVKGVYHGAPGTELDEATRNAIRQRQLRQQF